MRRAFLTLRGRREGSYGGVLGFLALCVAFCIVGCGTIRLVADYDPKLDDGITALQKKTETFLVKLERVCTTPAGAYVKHLDFYDAVRVEISSLQVRADAVAQNRLTSEQLELLQDSMNQLEQQHRKGLTPVTIQQTRILLNAQFTSMLRLEMAKKRDGKA